MKKSRLILAIVMLITTTTAYAVGPSDQSDVRNTVQQVFGQLKSQGYGSLYDSFPRLAHECLVSAVISATTRSGFHQLDRPKWSDQGYG